MLPDFPVPSGMTESDLLRAQSEEGLQRRLERLYDISDEKFPDIRKPYDARLKRELDVIIQMEFPGYFLIVSDSYAGVATTMYPLALAGAQAQDHWWLMRSGSPIWIRLPMTCCSNGF